MLRAYTSTLISLFTIADNVHIIEIRVKVTFEETIVFSASSDTDAVEQVIIVFFEFMHFCASTEQGLLVQE